MIQDNIRQFIEYKGITPYKFCKNLGLSMGYLDKKGAIGTDKYLKIIEYYPEINPEWLLTGKGEMLRVAVPKTEVEQDNAKYIAVLEKNIKLQEQVLHFQEQVHELQQKLDKCEAKKFFKNSEALV